MAQQNPDITPESLQFVAVYRSAVISVSRAFMAAKSVWRILSVFLKNLLVILTLHPFEFNYKHDLCHFLVLTVFESHKDPSLLFTLDLKGAFSHLLNLRNGI